MSYWVSLFDERQECVRVTSHQEGGAFVLGGSDQASLNVTYNYAWFLYRFLDTEQGLYWLHGKHASDCAERLEKAVKELGTDQYKDYWAPTPGNVGHALNVLLQWAKQYPDAIFMVH